MKRKAFALSLMILLPSIIFVQDVATEDTQVGNLTIVMTGFKSDKGKVMIALANSEEGFSLPEKAFRVASAKIKDKKAEWIFESIPFGEYAIKLFHDENGNNKLDINFMDIPKEKYGFSNNPRVKFGPPKYDKTKFTFNSKSVTIEVKVK